MTRKSKSSGRWLAEHFSDPYVKQAQQDGYRSRAVYKLQALQEKDSLFKPGMTVIDLGAAPGSWAQLVQKLITKRGRLIGVDLLPIEPIDDVTFIQGDFTDDAVLAQLLAEIKAAPVDWVISDMAPNMSGNDSIDMPRAMYLGELALDFAIQVLKEDGGFLIKAFQGEGFEAFVGQIKSHFLKVAIRKPKASRGRSREVFLLARGFKRGASPSK